MIDTTVSDVQVFLKMDINKMVKKNMFVGIENSKKKLPEEAIIVEKGNCIDIDTDDDDYDDEDESETDLLDDEEEASLLISSDEEAELEAQRIRFPDILKSKRIFWEHAPEVKSTRSNDHFDSITSNINSNITSNAMNTNINNESKSMYIFRKSLRPRKENNRSSMYITTTPSPKVKSIQQNRRQSHHSNCSETSILSDISEMVESCGKIFLSKAQPKNLVLNCELCDLHCIELEIFARHLHDVHKLGLLLIDGDNEKENAPRNLRKSNRYLTLKSSIRIKKETLTNNTVTAHISTAITANNSHSSKSVITANNNIDMPIVETLPFISDKDKLFQLCGTVMILNQRELFLLCDNCDSKYLEMDIFVKHLCQQHNISEEFANDKNVQPKTEFKEELNVVEGLREKSKQIVEHNTVTNSTLTSDNADSVKTIIQSKSITNNDVLLKYTETIKENTSITRGSRKRGRPSRSNILKSSQLKRKYIEPHFTIRENPKRKTKASTVQRKYEEEKGHHEDARNIRRLSLNKRKSRDYTNRINKISNNSVHLTNHETIENLSNLHESFSINETVSHLEGSVLCGKTLCKRDMKTSTIAIESLNTILSNQDSTAALSLVSSIGKKSISLLPLKHFPCDQCSRSFTKSSRLIEHKRLHTGEKPFTCDQCGKQFRIKMRLNEHKMRHNTEKKYKCELCSLAVATKQDLTLHMRHHAGDRRYQCEICPKAFVRSSDLKIHVRIHTGEKPFICDICNKSFRANQNLIVHKRSHMGEDSKVYKCEHCEKRFMRNIDRKVHMRTHTGEKPFKCEICQRGYSSRVHVRSHIEREHVAPNGVGSQPRSRKKPGPKPKTLREELAKQKKLVEELQMQLISQTRNTDPIISNDVKTTYSNTLAVQNLAKNANEKSRNIVEIIPFESTTSSNSATTATESNSLDIVNRGSVLLSPLDITQKVEKHSSHQLPNTVSTNLMAPKTVLGIQQLSVTVSMQLENVPKDKLSEKKSTDCLLSNLKLSKSPTNHNGVKSERKIENYFTVVGHKTEV